MDKTAKIDIYYDGASTNIESVISGISAEYINTVYVLNEKDGDVSYCGHQYSLINLEQSI